MLASRLDEIVRDYTRELEEVRERLGPNAPAVRWQRSGPMHSRRSWPYSEPARHP